MKLSAEVIAEVLDIFREAIESIANNDPRDLSERVRRIDLEPVDGVLQLSQEFLKGRS